MIDLLGKPDGKFRYTFHMVDYFSKYHALPLQKSKAAKETAEINVAKIFS